MQFTSLRTVTSTLLGAGAVACCLGLAQSASCAGQPPDDSASSQPLVEQTLPTQETAPQPPDDPCKATNTPSRSAAVPSGSTQLILVTSNSWKDFEGTLQRFERACDRAPWNPVGTPAPVMLGRHGMGWGRGLHPDGEPGPVKAERDQRSPAGVFDLGEARGYAAQPPPGTTWPFQHSGNAWRCMDNPASDAYNTFVPTGGMLAPVPAGMAPREVIFDLMVFVLHNTNPVQRRAGSCVFLHVWSKRGVPTQGCVAMDRSTLADLLAWLSLDRRPVLAQMPSDVRDRVARTWGLPVAAR